MTVPTLDETLTVTTDDPALASFGPYVYSRLRGSSGEGLAFWGIERDARSWEELRDATRALLYARDDTGQVLPAAFANTDTLRLEFPESGQVFEWTVTAYEPPDLTDDWTKRLTRNCGAFTLTPPAETRGGQNLPEADAEARFTVRQAGAALTRTLWCARMDFTMRDMLRTDAAGLVEVEHDSRFHVRYSPDWEVGRLFTYRGESWQVKAIREIGRRRGLELLARRSE